MFHKFLLILSITQQYFCQLLQYIDERDITESHNFQFNIDDYLIKDECIIYGLWSKFSPLSVIDFEQKNSNIVTNCYNLLNTLEINTRKSNFLYYDCLDLMSKKIQKIIQFVDEKHEQHNFIIDLDTYQYEDTWYYFGISLWVIQNKFELLIRQNINLLFYSSLDFMLPFYDKNLIITFGGELYLNENQRVSTWYKNQLFSSFPGYLSYYTVQIINDFAAQEMHQFAIHSMALLQNCYQSWDIVKTQFPDLILKFIDTDILISKNDTCDSFSLYGWIKGINIKQTDQEFLYKFIQISANSDSELIINDNLCPFQLLYRIQNDMLYLQILTYSYTFPSFNLDLSSNPFLIRKEFELELQRVYQWHYISVRLNENLLTTQITFYEREIQYQLNFNTLVNQFQNFRFKISVGNLFKNKNNYIDMKIFALTLISKWVIEEQKNCHPSCKTCEGPTQFDCLSCDQDLLRFYLPEFQSCVCPEILFDHANGACIDYAIQQFSLVEQKQSKPQCQYGYFKYDESTCIQCPSNPNTNSIFCLNCLQNPLTWKSNPVCETLLIYNKSDTLIYKKIREYDKFPLYNPNFLYYLSIQESVQLCKDCNQYNVINMELIYKDYLQIFLIQDHFCNYYDALYEYQNTKKCQFCNLDGCIYCQITIEQLICLKCASSFKLIDGKCLNNNNVQQLEKCQTPYYMNSQKICNLCSIENCLYCFEYLQNDLQKNTLYKDYNTFNIDDFHSIGCSLCQDGYKFNFLTKKCVNELPKISNCKRSFINLEGVEICTLADSQSFEIAPEIINCQWKIKKCHSCIKTPYQAIKCIVCDDEYSANIFSGQCEPCSIQNSKKCIQGSIRLGDGWVQLIQSFMMQFLNKNYFYPNPLREIYTVDQIIKCEDGYQIFNVNTCEKYCNSDCLKCIKQFTVPQGFICVECPRNYYNQPSRSTDQRNCVVCPKLCSICEPRTSEQINKLNQYFIITEENVQFTHKCIQQIQREDVYIDQELQIAKLILKDQNKILNFDVPLLQYLDLQLWGTESFITQQSYIDFKYCNQIGIDKIQITLKFESKFANFMIGTFNFDNMIENTLKQKIFSLKLIIFNLIGQQQELNQFSDHLKTKNFDYIYITKIDFYLINPNYFIFYNDLPIYLSIQNCTFQSQNAFTYGVFNINTSDFQVFQVKNLIFQNLYLIDSIIFNISGKYLLSEVIILDILFENCEFINSSFITVFNNQQDINILNLRIINSTFNNSNLIDLNTHNSFSKIGQFKNIYFFNNKFYNCDFIKIFNFQQFYMSNILIFNNYVFNSTLFTINSNFFLGDLIIESNIYKNSIFLMSANVFYLNRILYLFQNTEIKENKFLNSQVFSITQQYSQDQYEFSVYFKDLLIQNNQIDKSYIIQPFLFEIHCNVLQFHNIKIISQFQEIWVIYIYNTVSIQIQQLNFTNPFEDIKIPMGQDCLNNFKLLQIIKVFGFNIIKLYDIYLNNLYVQDLSILELTSNILFNVDSTEQIQMKNIFFQDNNLLKQNIGKRTSLIYIYSENIQNIILDQIYFLQNTFHQTADDLSENVAGLIYINSQMSKTTITNIVSKYNCITNSSCSFLYFITNSLFITNYQIDGLNIFNDQLLKRYIQNTETFKYYTKEQKQLIIQKFVPIQTKGTVCYAIVTQLEIKNSIFQNILSYKSPLFELKTEGNGLITFENLFIRNVDVIYDKNLEIQGNINIYSLNSWLNLNFINIIFDQVQNKFSSSILSITPSLRKNQVIFKNVQILNSLSLLNQVIKAEFSEIVQEFNYVHFQNISIIQTEQAWYYYFQKIGKINSEDLQKIMNDNGMINVGSCTLIIENLFVEGIIQSPVIKVQNLVNLKITYCKFQSTQTFFQFNMIQIGQNKYNSMKIIINNNEFRNLKLLQLNNQQLIQQLSLQDEINIDSNCKFDNYNLIFYTNSFSFADVIGLFQSQQSSGSLINLQSLSNQTDVLIQSLKIIENSCNFCLEGLISINIEQISKFKIKEFICIKNQIIKFGCLNIQSNKAHQNQFTLSDSVMALNVGYSGVGISFTNLRGIIQRTLVFNNSAVHVAGGMDIKVLENNFRLKNTLIFQNEAEQCGGIYINNLSNLQIDNFIYSLALFNKAKELANNIVETPTQLALIINDSIRKHYLEKIDNITYSILQISAQRVKQQNNVYFTNNLILPSNQRIINYKIFDLQTLQFIPYITEFSLQFLNNQREQLGNFENQNCSVLQNIIQLNGSLINQSELFSVSFDNRQNKIDLGHLYFTFDPYDSSQYIQEIEIICNISEYQALSYKLKTKSFYCQIGEFYTNGGCQICDSKFGFYSVSINATKCSIFDKTKFSKITSNTISLLPGFWRPDFFSDLTEFCYQKQKNCLGGWGIGDSSCLQGNLGGLCFECDFYNVRGNGYYFKNTENDECSLCDNSNNYVMYFIIVSLIAMVSTFMTLRSIEKTNLLFNNLKIGKKYGKIIFKLNQDHESFLIKMFLNYLWIFSLIFTYNINFSINLNIVNQASNTSYSMANNLDCFLAQMQEINLVYVRLIATIFLILIQLILVFLILVLLSRIRRSNSDLSNISNTSLYLYISNNAALTKQFCTLIAKKTISNIDFVQGNMALRFDSKTHQNWIFMFILPGLSLNGCIIPLLLITILFIKRNQLEQIQIRKYFCYLFNEYNENNYYWEQIKIWQKTILIIIMVYFEARVFLKTTLFGLTLIIYQYLANFYKPYIILSLNKLDYQAGQLCCIAIFLAAARNENNLSNSLEISSILQITIAFLCLFLIVLYTNILLKAYYKKYKLAYNSY